MIRIATLDNASRNAMLSALITQLDTGTSNAIIEIFTAGRSQKLATLTMAKPSFGTPANGSMTANLISPDVSADANGVAAIADVRDGNNTVRISGLSVGTSAAELNFNTVSFTSASEVSLTSFVITLPA